MFRSDVTPRLICCREREENWISLLRSCWSAAAPGSEASKPVSVATPPIDTFFDTRHVASEREVRFCRRLRPFDAFVRSIVISVPFLSSIGPRWSRKSAWLSHEVVLLPMLKPLRYLNEACPLLT